LVWYLVRITVCVRACMFGFADRVRSVAPPNPASPSLFPPFLPAFISFALAVFDRTLILPSPPPKKDWQVMNEIALHRGRSPHLNTIDAFVDGQHLTEAVVRLCCYFVSCFARSRIYDFLTSSPPHPHSPAHSPTRSPRSPPSPARVTRASPTASSSPPPPARPPTPSPPAGPSSTRRSPRSCSPRYVPAASVSGRWCFRRCRGLR
jgi:hypothetical protein